MLRLAILGIGVAFVAGAAALLLSHAPLIFVIYLGLSGAVIIDAILLARGRYRPDADRDHDRWQNTGERFVDPSSGHLVEVRYDPKTGERDYVDVREDSDDPQR